jgi:hypothetical protein
MKPFMPPSLVIAGGIGLLVVALGFFLQLSVVTQIWPWEVSRLSALFLSSILVAIAVPSIWVALTGEYAPMLGGAINLGLMFAGLAAFFFQLYAVDRSRTSILLFGVLAVPAALSCVVVIAKTLHLPFVDPRPMPALVRYSFVGFALALVLVGGALVFRTPNVFPWPMHEELLVIYGWIFLGAMCYFVYGALRPMWANAQGQLLGFLAYDLVLIWPFLQHSSTVLPEQRLSLIIYVSVLVYSGALAIYYLFVHDATRFRSFRELRG